jgi:hypothetical protein
MHQGGVFSSYFPGTSNLAKNPCRRMQLIGISYPTFRQAFKGLYKPFRTGKPPEKPIRPLSLKGGFALSIRALTLIKTKYFVLIKVKGGAETQVGALGLPRPNKTERENRPDKPDLSS